MNNIKTAFTIKDLENITGVKAHTIRIWEKRYNLLEPNRTDTNIRFYSPESLQKLLNVVLLNKYKYKISKIAQMSDQQILLNARELAFKHAANDEAINDFKIAMFQFDKVLFNNAYNKLLHKKTFREIFKEVFIPFLENIGFLWQTNTLLPAHEHFISNLILQKIQLNIEKLDYTASNNECLYVLFLPENEIHEIGLMYVNYELVLRGFQTIYLGESLPLSNLDYFLKGEQKIYFVTSMTFKPYDDEIEDYLNNINEILSGSENEFSIIGPRALIANKMDLSSNIKVYNNVLSFLNSF